MENLRANNYICHLTVFKKDLLKQSGVFRRKFDGSQDHDLILRLCEKASMICHIPKVLYFWRAHKGSVALSIDSKNYAVEAGLQAVRSHLERCGIQATVSVTHNAMSVYQVNYDLGMMSVQDITILCEQEYENAGKSIWQAVEDSCSYILILKKGLLVPEDPDLEKMLMHMVDNKVAAVTGKIINKQGKIISGGVVFREEKGQFYIRHLFGGVPVCDPGYMNQLTYASGIPVICNGCILVRKEHVIAALKHGRNLFDLSDWIRWSIDLQEQGYQLINETRTLIVANRNFPWYNKKSYVYFQKKV